MIQPSEGAPHCNSGKKPQLEDWVKTLKETILCVGLFASVLLIAVFICLCILLSKTNTDEVKGACSGFWEFMLIALLSPIVIPLFYCLYSCLFFMNCPWKWNIYSGTFMLTFGLIGLHMSITASENPACVKALRNSTPPLPWLLYVSWGKTVLFLCGAISSFYAPSIAQT